MEFKYQMKRLSVTNLSSENNLPTISFAECSSCHHAFALMTTAAFSRNISKLFFKLKLVTDNLFIYAEANWEATESLNTVDRDALHICVIMIRIWSTHKCQT